MMMDTSNLKEIFVVGRPRSGTVWLNKLLADALNSPLEAPGPNAEEAKYFGPGRDGGYVIRKQHDEVKRGMTVFIQRDPRDVAISTMFFRNTNNLMAIMKQMCEPYENSYERHIRMWLDMQRAEVHTKYERLHNRPTHTLGYIVSSLTRNRVDMRHMENVVERQSFRAIKSVDTEGQYEHSMRKGVVGDWKNHFTREAGQYIQQHLGKFMLDQKYVTDPMWWKDLEK